MSLKSLYLRYIFLKLNLRIKVYKSRPLLVQEKLLFQILHSFKKTEFENQFKTLTIKSMNDLKLRKVMNISDLESFTDKILKNNKKNLLINGKLNYLAQSGGSTGKHKYLPYPPKLIKKFQDFQIKTAASACNKARDFKLLDDQILVNPATLKTEDNDNIKIGMATGIMTKHAPGFARRGVYPTIETISIKDTNQKIKKIKQEVQGKNIKVFSSPPSFAIPILEEVIGDKKNIHDIWKEFKIYIWSGSPLRNYKQRIKELIGETPTFEVYSSTESAIAFEFGDEGGLLLDLDMSVFLFQVAHSDYNSQKFSADEVELEKRYRILLTTFGGLINYNLGDLVEFIKLSPPMIKVIGREKEDVIIGGAERIKLEELHDIILDNCYEFKVKLHNYVLFPYQNESQKKGYHWYFEFESPPQESEYFLYRLEEKLLKLSLNYSYMRENNARLLSPMMSIANPGQLDIFLNNKKVFAQGKILQVYNDIEAAKELLEFLTPKFSKTIICSESKFSTK